ncbi:MAG: transcriptional regulator [Chloroflexi bacterium RBG_13_53_26]|nr:MAG: transcriptional regulator [Chloroflexi bacterium RBG_13_53_26]
MDSTEFAEIRHYLGKTQEQLARLLGVSPKAIQSFEQGWRNIPAHSERQLLFLLYLKSPPDEGCQPCWDITSCPSKERRACPAWEFKAGNLCWFINGTICQGKVQQNWQKKMQLCRQCEVFRSLIPDFD